VTVYLDPEQYEALKALSQRTMIPMAVYIRQALGVVLANAEARGGADWSQ